MFNINSESFVIHKKKLFFISLGTGVFLLASNFIIPQENKSDLLQVNTNIENNIDQYNIVQKKSLSIQFWNDQNGNLQQEKDENISMDNKIKVRISLENKKNEVFEYSVNNKGVLEISNLQPENYLIEYILPKEIAIIPNQFVEEKTFQSKINMKNFNTILKIPIAKDFNNNYIPDIVEKNRIQ